MSSFNQAWMAGAAMTLLSLIAHPASAQVAGIVNYWQQATGNWDNAGNWSIGTVPSSATEDFAVIGGVNGPTGISVGTATVSANVSSTPGGVALGLAAANSGTLNIASGGSLTVVDTIFDGNGNVYAGIAGTGTINIDRGGSLTAVGLNSGGNAASLIRLGGVGGAGMAVVNVNDANLARNTRVIGTNVDFTATNSLSLNGNLIAQITSASGHSALKANELAIISGTLTVEIDPSIAPAVGNTWNLVNARQVAGSFANVNLANVPELALGRVYNVRTQAGGLGKLVQLAVEERLVLNVDRNSGMVSISNPGASAFSVDGYTVQSATVGALNPSGWTPLAGTWDVANSTANRISQLNPDAAPSFGPGSSQQLGVVFVPPAPAEFGTHVDDLAFQYTQPNEAVQTGVVNYIGTAGINNLTLRVDPASGAAQLRNTSPFDVLLDGYTIASESASLDVNQWSSLDDQNTAGGDWQESSVSSSRLSELKFAGGHLLGAGQSFNLGNPFNESGGKKDLSFQFALRNENVIRTGYIVYETIAATLDGDFSGNGVVDAADYVVWRNNNGSQTDYLLWRSNFGATLGAGGGASLQPSGLNSPAVPEPTTVAFFVATVVIGVCGRSMRI